MTTHKTILTSKYISEAKAKYALIPLHEDNSDESLGNMEGNVRIIPGSFYRVFELKGFGKGNRKLIASGIAKNVKGDTVMINGKMFKLSDYYFQALDAN